MSTASSPRDSPGAERNQRAAARHSPELREQLVAGQREGRRGMAAQLTGVPEEEIGDDVVRSVGSVQLALLFGVMAQRLDDPPPAPSAAEVVAGLRAIAGRFAPVR